MKKGFTLIELLIVMIVVGILVTIALPKYHTSLERGRVIEALTNLKTASDVVNAHYVMDGNTYKCSGVFDVSATADKKTFLAADMFTKGEGSDYGRYFDEPKRTTACVDSVLSVSISTERRTGDYTLTAYNEDGELKYIFCESNPVTFCEEIGAEPQTVNNQTLYLLDVGQ